MAFITMDKFENVNHCYPDVLLLYRLCVAVTSVWGCVCFSVFASAIKKKKQLRLLEKCPNDQPV